MRKTTNTISENDIMVLRKLGEEKARISSLEIHREKAHLWTCLNDKKMIRPMVWMDEIPWHEMNYNNELTLECENDWAKTIETTLRREIYQWKHMPTDMIVSSYISCPIVINDTGYGLDEEVDIVSTDEQSDVVSRHFKPQISKPEDVDKIVMPQISIDMTKQKNITMICL